MMITEHDVTVGSGAWLDGCTARIISASSARTQQTGLDCVQVAKRRLTSMPASLMLSLTVCVGA